MAGTPGQIRSIAVSGDFANPQYVNNYIDCTGLTFNIEYFGNPETISGSSLVNGTFTFEDSNGGTTTITADPTQFSTAGIQDVIFSATQTGVTAYPETVTTTTSVNVISNAKGLYAFLADGRKVKIGTIEAAPPVTVTGVTTNIVFEAQYQRSGRFNISYSNGTTSIVYPYSVNTATHIITYTAETPPGTFTYNHYEPIGVAYQALYYDYTEDGTTISDILMAVAGGGDN